MDISNVSSYYMSIKNLILLSGLNTATTTSSLPVKLGEAKSLNGSQRKISPGKSTKEWTSILKTQRDSFIAVWTLTEQTLYSLYSIFINLRIDLRQLSLLSLLIYSTDASKRKVKTASKSYLKNTQKENLRMTRSSLMKPYLRCQCMRQIRNILKLYWKSLKTRTLTLEFLGQPWKV